MEELGADCSIRMGVEKIINKFGKLDVLVNNAGVLFAKEFEDVALED